MAFKMDMNTLKRLTSPQAMKDLDRFLDATPMNVGYNALIAASLACLIAGGAVFFAALETEKVSKLHAELMQVEALQPPIPVLKYMPVPATTLKTLTTKIEKTYKGVSIVVNTDGGVVVTAQDTDYFPQFLAAISYLQRGGRNWKVRVDSMCVGRACTSSKLTANFKVEMVRFGEPEVKASEEKK